MSNTIPPTSTHGFLSNEKAVHDASNTVPLDSDTNTSEPQLSTSHPQKPWDKPGISGSIRRSWRSVQRYIWDDPDKAPEEKRFLLKLDFFLLSYTCLGYFCKNLDQANINNAYVSGMRESLGMYGSQLTYMGNVFTAGYVIGQLPAVILVTKFRPSILVSSLEILWAVFTFCCAAVNKTSQLYALRFLIGLCEGAFFPCIIYVIGSWYTKSERGKRTTLFYCTATLAGMFSGYLQAGAYKGLNGVLGHAGWQWLYIICGIISLPIGVIGYFFNPDFPETTRAFYLSAAEAEFARNRLVKDGYKPLGAAAWNRKKILYIMRQWQFWVLPVGYFFVQSSLPSQQPVFALWLKATKHTIYEINVWPTGQAAIGVVVQVAAGMLSDSPLLGGRRWQAITFMQGGTIFACLVLAVWSVPNGLKYVAFYMSYMAAGVPGIYYAWFPDLMPDDHEMRGFMIAVSNVASYINQIWVLDAVWRTIEAPKYRPGFISATVFGTCLIATSLLMRYLEKRDTKRRERNAHEAIQVDLEAPVIHEAHIANPEK